MEQFVREPVYVYNNKTVDTQPVIKQELPKYQCERNSTYQNDSFKKELSKNLFAKAGPSLDKILSCSRVNLSISQSLVLNYVEAGALLSEFTQNRGHSRHLPNFT